MSHSSSSTPSSSSHSVDNGTTSSHNCTGDPIFVAAGHPINASLSFTSILLNVCVILVVRFMAQKKQIPVKNLFFVLAASDCGVGVIYATQAMCHWCFDACSMTRTAIIAVNQLQSIAIFSNRGITLYVTWIRAVAVGSVTAESFQNKRLPRIFAEITLFILLGSLPMLLQWLIPMTNHEADILRLSYFVLLTMWMMIFATFIFFKVRLLKRSSPASKSSSTSANSGVNRSARDTRASTSKDDFQTLVLLVAFIFCACHLMGVIFFSFRLTSVFTTKTTMILAFWLDTAMLFNSAVNFLVYVAASRSFRRAFVQYVNQVVRRDVSRETQTQLTVY